nr:MAG TPA: hypothetical protein [Caudoviricetes sp.]
MTLAVHFPFLLFKHLLLQHIISVIISPFFDNFIQKMRYISVDIPHYVIVLFILLHTQNQSYIVSYSPTRAYEL